MREELAKINTPKPYGDKLRILVIEKSETKNPEYSAARKKICERSGNSKSKLITITDTNETDHYLHFLRSDVIANETRANFLL